VVKVNDVTDLNACETLFSELQNEFKSIDLVVYSSGVGDPNYELAWEKELPTLQTNVFQQLKFTDLPTIYSETRLRAFWWNFLLLLLLEETDTCRHISRQKRFQQIIWNRFG